MKKKKVKSDIELVHKNCDECNTQWGFYLHKCPSRIQEFYGCKVCDNWCLTCKDDDSIKKEVLERD